MTIIKTEASHGKDFVYRWSTHVPVVNTILEILNPELIVELGIGHFSSPLFFNSNAKKIIHIENDKNWLSIIKKEYLNKIDNRSEFRHHILNNINLSKHLNDLSQNERKEIENYYSNLSSEIKTMNFKTALMFTDGYTSTRRLSIDILTKDFQVVIYHDAEEPKTYDYYNIKKELYESYDNYILKTIRTHTGFFIKKNYVEQNTLKTIMNKNIHNYVKSINVNNEGFELIKI